MKVERTELVWPGKYDEDGNRIEPPRVSLPFQVIETVNTSRAAREAASRPKQTLFDYWNPKEGATFEDGWRNKLIWGDNLLVMNSLMDRFEGKVDLIYIDPPFMTGADFSFRTPVGEEATLDLPKDPSPLEDKAYRDTWGKGVDSYIQMLAPRVEQMQALLTDDGTILVHMGWDIAQYVKVVFDARFGLGGFVNQIIWKRQTAHSDTTQGSRHLGRLHDVILMYRKGEGGAWNMEYTPYDEAYSEAFYKHVEAGSGRRYMLDNLTGPGGAAKGNPYYEVMGVSRYWRYSRERMLELIAQGRVVQAKPGSVPRYKRYLDEMRGVPLQDLWTDIPPVQPQSAERLGYDTQKPERLLDRIIRLCSHPDSLVVDFFCGSGTTAAVAEKLGRRWINCDLSRYAIHVARKRLLDIEGCKPFEILNLGKYERQYWQDMTFGADGRDPTRQAVFQYLAFVLKLYKAEPVAGMEHIHGRRAGAMVHIGAIDAPVTIDEITHALDECAAVKQRELHVLGWEWEMGLAGPNNDVRAGGLMHETAKRRGVKLVLLQIPREVMEEQAVVKGDVQFFELAYLDVTFAKPKQQTVVIELKDFVIPNSDLIPDDVRAKIAKWSDYIDYWSVDWDFQNDTFMQGFATYRTRRNRKLPLVSDPHTYENPGEHHIVVKVIDVFGNDTSQGYSVVI